MFSKIARVVAPLVLVAAGVFVALPASVAGAAGTGLITETFENGSLTNPGGWSVPSGGATVCLTAGTSVSPNPLPDCQSSGGDTVGQGALQLTDNADTQVGTIYSTAELPTANGLDVTWTSYQYNGTGADGISFDLAAVNPADPTPPATVGPTGGSLGYSTDQSENGVPYGYLGFGADVYGNYENSSYGGSDCNQSSSPAPESLAVRGPGNGTSGYCLLNTDTLSSPYTLDDANATTRSTSIGVPEEVVINTTSSPVVATAAGVTVQPGYYLFAAKPLYSDTPGGGWTGMTGALPTNPTGVPSGWLNSSTGLPEELAFGFASSTGGSTEFHDINLLQASSLTAAPVLSITSTDSGSGTLYGGQSATLTLTPGVSSSSTVSEDQSLTVTDTLPSNLTPTAASGTGYTSCSIAGHVVTCIYPAGSISPGTTINPITITATASSSTGNYSTTASVTSTDGAPATAVDAGTIQAQTPQSISYTNTPPSPAYVGGTYTVTTNGGGASGNPVVLSVDGSSTSGCTINPSTGVVTLSAPVGTCVIDANQAGSSTYTIASQVQQTVAEVKIPQAITFTNTAPVNPNGGTSYNVSATGGNSGNAITYSVDGSSTSGCTVNPSSGIVSLDAPIGTCVVDANQAGNSTYLAASQVQQSVTDVPLAQVINFTNTAPTNPQVNTTYTVTATGGASTSPVVLSVSGSSTSGCTINSSTGVVTLSAPAGTCIVVANQAAEGLYAPANVTNQTVTSVVIPQAVTFTNTPPTSPQVNTTYTVTATGGASGNPVVYSVDGSSTSGCTVVSSTGVVTLAAPAGTCVINANQAGVVGSYGVATQVQQSVTSVVIPQTLVFTNTPPVAPFVGSTYTVVATGGGVGSSIVYSVDGSSTAGCTVNSSTGVVILSAPAGRCVIDANKAAVTGIYSVAPQIQQTVSSRTIPQTVTFTNTPPTLPAVGSTYTVVATGGGSGNVVVFSVDKASTSGCTVTTQGLVTLSAPAGTCVIDANQAGNSSFSASPQAQQRVASAALPQKVVITSAPPKPPTGSQYTVTAKGGGSGNPITFSIGPGSSPKCSVSVAGVVLFKAPGITCVVVASQAGNATYDAGQTRQVVHAAQAALALVLHYANNSWALSQWSQTHLKDLALTLKRNHFSQVRLDGFASSTGTTPRNNVLGMERARVAAAYLRRELTALGVHGVNLSTVGNGATQFVARPSTSAGNRRTVITIK